MALFALKKKKQREDMLEQTENAKFKILELELES